MRREGLRLASVRRQVVELDDPLGEDRLAEEAGQTRLQPRPGTGPHGQPFGPEERLEGLVGLAGLGPARQERPQFVGERPRGGGALGVPGPFQGFGHRRHLGQFVRRDPD